MVVVIFAFVGAEIVTIAAAESGEPEQNVTRAVNQVVLRVLTFYVLAIFLIVCVMSWKDVKPGESPFIASLEKIGIPGAADVMNAIVVTAVLSCLNSGMYTGSRMLFALARRGDAPKGLLDTNRRGVPVKAILLTSSIGFASTIIAYLSPDTVFLFLVNSSGAIALFVYILIACSELRMRRRLEREAPERLKVSMWAYPYLTYFAIAAMVVVVGAMALVKDVRPQLIPSFMSLAVVLAAYWIKTRAERRRDGDGRRRLTPPRWSASPSSPAPGPASAGPSRSPCSAPATASCSPAVAGTRWRRRARADERALGRPGRRHRPGVRAGAVRRASNIRRLDVLFNNAGTSARRRAARGLHARGVAARRRHESDRRVPVRAGGVPRDEGPGPARRADHQQRLDLGPGPAPELGRLHRHEARDHRPDESDLARRSRVRHRAAGRSTSATPRPTMTAGMKRGVLQADGTVAPEPTMDVGHVAAAVVYMAGLPLDANVEFLTIMATKMPFIGRG